jgi:hypothetical protein
MLVVETIARIRRADFVQKKPIKAVRTGLSAPSEPFFDALSEIFTAL